MHARQWVELALLCAAAAAVAPAQAQVYKCTGSNGEPVYAQHPCGAGAKEVELRSQRSAAPSSGETATRTAVFRSTDLSDAAIAERNCAASARANIYGPVDSRIAGYQRQIGELNRQLTPPSGTLADATYTSGVRAQIASVQQSISSERQTAETSLTAARQRCADQRRDREADIERRYQAGGAASGTAER